MCEEIIVMTHKKDATKICFSFIHLRGELETFFWRMSPVPLSNIRLRGELKTLSWRMLCHNLYSYVENTFNSYPCTSVFSCSLMEIVEAKYTHTHTYNYIYYSLFIYIYFIDVFAWGNCQKIIQLQYLVLITMYYCYYYNQL